MIPAHVRHALEQLARLEPGELTACGPVLMGTETARALLSALGDAETLARVRALIAAGTAPATVATLLAAPVAETCTLNTTPHDERR